LALKDLDVSCESGDTQALFKSAIAGTLYDEIGDPDGFGWFGLIVVDSVPYILNYFEGVAGYKEYPSLKSAKKAWDHVCARYERWFIRTNGD
jgi:hypothetical protein